MLGPRAIRASHLRLLLKLSESLGAAYGAAAKAQIAWGSDLPSVETRCHHQLLRDHLQHRYGVGHWLFRVRRLRPRQSPAIDALRNLSPKTQCLPVAQFNAEPVQSADIVAAFLLLPACLISITSDMSANAKAPASRGGR